MPIHPTALISSEARIDPSADIGAFVVIEGPVQIGARCRVLPHAQVLGDTTIGEGTTIGRGAVIGEDPQDLGFDAGTLSGVRIGPDNVIREHVTIHRGSKAGGMTAIGTGNFVMGRSSISWGLSCSSRSTKAEQAWRTRPLMTIVHAPHTSSRQLQSQATGATRLPSTVVALAAMRCRTLITFISRSYGTR